MILSGGCGREVSLMMESAWTSSQHSRSHENQQPVNRPMLGCWNSPVADESGQNAKGSFRAQITLLSPPPSDLPIQRRDLTHETRKTSILRKKKEKKRNEAEASTYPTPNTTKCHVTWPKQQGSRELTVKTHSVDINWHTVAQIVWNYK